MFTNFLFAQTIVVNPSPLVTEVGISTNYNLTFSGSSPSNTHYRIDNWLIIANIGSGTIAGNINGQASSSYYYNPPLNTIASLSNSTSINIPITYGSNAPDTDNIEFQVSGFYGTVDGNNNFISGPALFAKYKKQNGDSGYGVDVKIVCAPAISAPTILSCCTNDVQICASGYCDANQFNWTVFGGTIASGSGTNCITITPSSTGNVSATCVVSRSTGLSNYTATNTRIISRTARTASFIGVYSTTPPYNYICKGSGGRQMKMLTQCGLSTINWIAPNCTITGQNTLTPTITPLSSVATGTAINVSATVTFIGGCTATTPSISFQVLDSTVAPTPVGYFTATPSNGNICTTPIFDIEFVSTNGFNNGITTVSKSFIWGPGDTAHYIINKSTAVTVCNKNLCTGLTTCKVFNVFPPAPCAGARMANTSTGSRLIIAPNPSNGNVKITLPETISGTYQVYDQTNSTLVQEAKFDNQTELQIELYQKIRSGIYVLKVITENNTFIEKIILNK